MPNVKVHRIRNIFAKAFEFIRTVLRHRPQFRREHHAIPALVKKFNLFQRNVCFRLALGGEKLASPFAGEFVPDNEFVGGVLTSFNAKWLFHAPAKIAIFAISARKMCFYAFLWVNIRIHGFLHFLL
jgi:hypothetical protein